MLTLIQISIHALLAESDTGPCKEAKCITYFYPRSPCGERLHAPSHNPYLRNISIHALLAESDVRVYELVWGVSISIHALLAESDTPNILRHCTTYLFLSTLSLRRATLLII